MRKCLRNVDCDKRMGRRQQRYPRVNRIWTAGSFFPGRLRQMSPKPPLRLHRGDVTTHEEHTGNQYSMNFHYEQNNPQLVKILRPPPMRVGSINEIFTRKQILKLFPEKRDIFNGNVFTNYWDGGGVEMFFGCGRAWTNVKLRDSQVTFSHFGKGREMDSHFYTFTFSHFSTCVLTFQQWLFERWFHIFEITIFGITGAQ